MYVDALFSIFISKKNDFSQHPGVWDLGSRLSQSGAGSENFEGKIGCTLKPASSQAMVFIEKEEMGRRSSEQG